MGLHYSKSIVNFESFLLRFSSISEKWNRESSEENPFLLTSDELWLDYSTQIDADCSFLHHMFLSILVIRNWNRQLTLNLSLLPNLETNQFLADRYIIPESGLKKKSTLAFFRQLIIYYYLLPPASLLPTRFFQDLRTCKTLQSSCPEVRTRKIIAIQDILRPIRWPESIFFTSDSKTYLSLTHTKV